MTHIDPLRLDSIAIHAGRGGRVPGTPVNPPVVFTSIYHADEDELGYAREQNPTWEALEDALGALEGGRAVTFASGMAAIDAVVHLAAEGSAVVAPYDAYTGSRTLLADLAQRGRFEVRLVDIADTAATVRACEGAGLLLLESPTNPLLAVPDLPAVIAGAHEQGVVAVVDNTFATPLRQRPLDLGADVVMHSATKFLSGHADVLMGAVVTADEALRDRLRDHRTLRGAVPGPMEAFLALRGLRTLAVRLDRAEANAAELARRLSVHPAVGRVRYPGLASDPGHERARGQMTGFGAMLAVEFRDVATAEGFCHGVTLAVHATSLGGIETTVERRAARPLEDHVPPPLVRISVGCEHVDDLWADFSAALGSATGTQGSQSEVRS